MFFLFKTLNFKTSLAAIFLFFTTSVNLEHNELFRKRLTDI